MAPNSISNYAIATLGSHSSLQIMKGAKDEGFKTILLCQKDRAKLYKTFRLADEVKEIETMTGFLDFDDYLCEKNAFVVPHGSFVAYLNHDKYFGMKSMHFGSKEVIRWEGDRERQRAWLKEAGLKLPKLFDKPEDIDCPSIVKFHGARGGRGYFLTKNSRDFYARWKEVKGTKYQIQEYIVGVPIYIHYFHSPLTGETEIIGCDKRYETNVDSIGRIAAKDQMELNIESSYSVSGNTGLVLRESLLPEALEMGESVVEKSKELAGGKGLYGPFCLETVVTPEMIFYTFEISTRIVAGTNVDINGSPYAWLKYNKPVSTGRRIAMEIRQAIEEDKIKEITGD